MRNTTPFLTTTVLAFARLMRVRGRGSVFANRREAYTVQKVSSHSNQNNKKNRNPKSMLKKLATMNR